MTQAAFDPGQHLSTIKGQNYLEVKWRLAWLRSEHPDAILTTQLESHLDDRAIFSARVELADGGSATGWGSETATSFGNYIEKAETKAIGRALAALGFGTQFCLDFDDGPETGVLADAPVQFRNTAPPRQVQEQRARSNDPMSDSQRRKIMAMTRNLGISPAVLEEIALSAVGTSVAELTKITASRVIDALVLRENEANARIAS